MQNEYETEKTIQNIPKPKHKSNHEMDTEQKKDFRDQSYVPTKCNKFR